MKNYILTLFITCSLVGCSEKKADSNVTNTSEHETSAHQHEVHVQGEGDPRAKEVMAIHDSIMPAMSTIMELKAKIAHQIKSTDSLLTKKSDVTLKKRRSQATSIQTQLEKADDEMMGWMHQYHADTLEKLDEKSAADYLSAQKIKIEAVRVLMKESIENAESFLQETKK